MIIASILSAIRRNRRYRSNLNALCRLDDRMLADIGLARGSIQAAARELTAAA
jgi:uncharacterized protein YjiS (DUF1127 family)